LAGDEELGVLESALEVEQVREIGAVEAGRKNLLELGVRRTKDTDHRLEVSLACPSHHHFG
jgi:hypothetical protein